MARALYQKERLSVLKLCLIAFDHDITILHDKLATQGQVEVLGLVLRRALTSVTIHWVEVFQICELIAMAYRCSDDAAIQCMGSAGTDLVVLLFSILLKDESGASRGSASPVRAIIRRICCLELSFRKIDKPDKLLLFLEQMALLGNDDQIISLEAISILAGLTCDQQSKLFVMESPTFLHSLVKCGKVGGSEMQYQVARVLQNLTLHGSNKAKMTCCVIIDQLVALASPQQSNITRGLAMQALNHLTVEAKGKLFIVVFQGGQVLKSLLVSANNRFLQPIVVETLLRLTCHYTASPLVNYPGEFETELAEHFDHAVLTR